MNTPFEIESFEEYPATTRNELPDGRRYFRGETNLLSTGYLLKPSIGRYPESTVNDHRSGINHVRGPSTWR